MLTLCFHFKGWQCWHLSSSTHLSPQLLPRVAFLWSLSSWDNEHQNQSLHSFLWINTLCSN